LPQIPNIYNYIRTILAHETYTIDNGRIFNIDLVDDYLKLAQLLDPRVCNRTKPYTSAEIDRLLQHLLKYMPTTDEAGDVSEEEDAFDSPCES
jgi:hypothetical protein